jgi:hypothetical protein
MRNRSLQSDPQTGFNSKTILHVLAALLLSTALAALASAQNTVAFYDGTFSPAWVGSVAGITGTVTFSFAPAGGGFPGSCEKETHKLTASGGQAFMYLANFNPANSFTGAFKSLSYSYDLTNPGTHDVLYAIAVEQIVAGVPTVYIPDKTQILDIISLGNTFAAAPNPFFTTGLTATQFCKIPSNAGYGNDIDCTQNPNFSSSTQQTVFGYVVGNSFTGNGSGKYKTGIDNWCVVLDGASGPGGMGRGCRGVL